MNFVYKFFDRAVIVNRLYLFKRKDQTSDVALGSFTWT